MKEHVIHTPLWRLALAFIVVPGAAALLMAILQPLYAGLPNYWDRVFRTALVYVVVGAYPSAIVLGVPAYFLLRNRLRPTIINCTVVGAIVASLPWFVLALFSSPDYASYGGVVTYENGGITLAGLFYGLIDIGIISIFGAAAGMLFWLITVPSHVGIFPQLNGESGA